jgi:hypothetical protein
MRTGGFSCVCVDKFFERIETVDASQDFQSQKNYCRTDYLDDSTGLGIRIEFAGSKPLACAELQPTPGPSHVMGAEKILDAG